MAPGTWWPVVTIPQCGNQSCVDFSGFMTLCYANSINSGYFLMFHGILSFFDRLYKPCHSRVSVFLWAMFHDFRLSIDNFLVEIWVFMVIWLRQVTPGGKNESSGA